LPPAETATLGLPPVTQFTTDPAIERDAAWSPDGQWISFGSMRGGNQDIWKKPVAGGEAIQLTNEPSAEVYAIWSPDGSKLAFTSNKGGLGNIWTVPADGGEMTRVTADGDSVSLLWAGGSIVSWSPDGESIAFSSAGTIADGGIKHDIRVVPATGGPSHAVTSGPADDVLPSWSPDGQSIAFQSDRSGELHIWVIPSTGGMATQVTGRPGVSDVVARWSPGRY
jgi:TolB protein